MNTKSPMCRVWFMYTTISASRMRLEKKANGWTMATRLWWLSLSPSKSVLCLNGTLIVLSISIFVTAYFWIILDALSPPSYFSTTAMFGSKSLIALTYFPRLSRRVSRGGSVNSKSFWFLSCSWKANLFKFCSDAIWSSIKWGMSSSLTLDFIDADTKLLSFTFPPFFSTKSIVMRPLSGCM